MASKPNLNTLATHESILGPVLLVVDNDAKRQVQHLIFTGVKTPAKGKTPSSEFSMTVSEFSKLAQFIPVIQEASIVSTLQMTQPVLCAAFVGMGEDTASLVKDMFASTLTFCEANKPEGAAGGPVERKIIETVTSQLANILLVLAGKSGEIPNTVDLSEYLVNAVQEAHNKAAKNGKDDLGQFRLKAEKTKKDDNSSKEDDE